MRKLFLSLVLYCSSMSVFLAAQDNIATRMGTDYFKLAMQQKKKGLYDSANFFLNELILENRLDSNKNKIVLELSDNLILLNRLDSAKYYLNELISQENENIDPIFMARTNSLLAKIKAEQYDFSTSIDYLEKSTSLVSSDSLVQVAQLLEIVESGLGAWNSSVHEKSLKIFDGVKPEIKKSSLWNVYFYLLAKQIESYWRLGQLEEAVKSSNRIIDESTNHFSRDNVYAADGYRHIAIVNTIKGNIKLALRSNEKELGILRKIDPPPLEKLLYGNSLRGTIYIRNINVDSATYYLESSLENCIDLFGANDIRTAKIYNNLGAMYLQDRQSAKSLSYLEKALQIRRYNNLFDPLSESNTYKNLGTANFNLFNYEEALKYYQKSKKILEKVYQSDHYLIAGLDENLGNAYNYLKEYDSAFYHISKAISHYKAKYGNENQFLGVAYNNIGHALMRKGNYKRALDYFELSLRINQRFFGSRSISTIRSYYNLAQLSFESDNFESALEYIDKSLAANLLKESRVKYTDKDIVTDFYIDAHYLWESQLLRGKIFERRYETSDNRADLEKALSSYNQSINIVLKEKFDYDLNEDKIELSGNTKIVFDAALRVSLKLYQLSTQQNTSLAYQNELYDIVQKFKASVLTNINKKIDAKNVIGVPDSLVRLEKVLNDRIDSAKTLLISTLGKTKVDSGALVTLKSEIFDLEREKELQEKVFLRMIPNYYTLKYATQIIEVKNIQQNLEAKTSLIEFYDADSAFYLFYLTPEVFDLQVIPKSEELMDIVFQGYDQAINKRGGAVIGAQFLYDLFIASLNIESSVSNLIIIPDGALWNVNFELLEDRNKSFNDKLMLNRFNISYAPSSFLLFNRRPKLQSADGHLLAFSYSDEDTIVSNKITTLEIFRDNENELPGSSIEILNISQFLEGDYYYGKSASESNFKSNASHYSLIHLAVHGVVNRADPNSSKLIFNVAADQENDGQLHVFELYNMQLNTNLVVLSACNSGDGKLMVGEGIMSLGRGFSYAGVESLVLSRWEVSDLTAPIIMKYFYEGLMDGMRKSEALSYAKREFLNKHSDNITSHPYYWAGFYVLGNDEPILRSYFFSSNNLIKLTVIAVTMFMMTLLVLFVNKPRLLR